MGTIAIAAYTGQFADAVALTYPLGNGCRHYLPGFARFSTPDRFSPFGAGGPNPYAYCAGDPINRCDPSGHISVLGVISDVLVDAALIADLAINVATGDIPGAILSGGALATTIGSQVEQGKGNRTASLWLGMGSMALSVPAMMRAGTKAAMEMTNFGKPAGMGTEETSASESTVAGEKNISEQGQSDKETTNATRDRYDSARRNSVGSALKSSLPKISDGESPVTHNVSSTMGRLANVVSIIAMGANIGGGIFSYVDALTEKSQIPVNISNRDHRPLYNPYRPTGYSPYSPGAQNPNSPAWYNPFDPYSSYYGSSLANNN